MAKIDTSIKTEIQALALVKKNPDNLEKVPENLRTEKVCLETMKNGGSSLNSVPEAVRTAEICLLAVKADCLNLEHVPEALKTEEVCAAALLTRGGDTFALPFVPKHIWQNEKFCWAVVPRCTRNVLIHIDKKLWKNKTFCETVIKNDPNSYSFEVIVKYVPQEFVMDLFKLCKDQTEAFQHLPKSFKTTERCLAVVRDSGRALSFVPKELLTAELYLAAVKANGYALNYVPNKYKTEELCFIAVSGSVNNFAYVPKKLATRVLAMAIEKKKLEANDIRSLPDDLRATARALFEEKQPSAKKVAAKPAATKK